MVGCWWCAYQSIHSFHGVGTVKITVGCPSCKYPSSRTKTCTRVGLLVRTAKEKGTVGTSTRADACVFTGDPQPRLFEFTSL